MIKKVLCALSVFICSTVCFADNLDDEVLKAISFLIPPDNVIVEVETPYYDKTLAASEFSVYLKNSIETVLSACGKELFDYDFNISAESKIAEYSDSGYSLRKASKLSQRKMPDGTLSTTFTEKNNTVTVFFDYGSFMGNKKTTKITVSTKDMPGLNYQPEKLEFAKTVYKDIENAKTVAKRNPETSIPITAALLDSQNNIADIIHPDSKVHFLIGSPEKDAYISILNINAEGKKFWLKFDKKGSVTKFIPAGEVWESPNFRPVNNVYGMETIYIYAASSPKGLPTADSESHYLPETITSITRELMLDLSDDEVSTGNFALSYTVLPSPLE